MKEIEKIYYLLFHNDIFCLIELLYCECGQKIRNKICKEKAEQEETKYMVKETCANYRNAESEEAI